MGCYEGIQTVARHDLGNAAAIEMQVCRTKGWQFVSAKPLRITWHCLVLSDIKALQWLFQNLMNNSAGEKSEIQRGMVTHRAPSQQSAERAMLYADALRCATQRSYK